MMDATAATSQFCTSTPMSVENRARYAAAIDKGGRDCQFVHKVVAERVEHKQARAVLTNLRRAKSKVGCAAKVARMSQAELKI